MAKFNRKWFIIGGGSAVGVASIVGLFLFLMSMYSFVITGTDDTCAGTLEDPCISFINITNPTIYNVDVYNKEQVKLEFSPEISEYYLFRKDGRCKGGKACASPNGLSLTGWNYIDFTNKTKPIENKAYVYRFPARTTKEFLLWGLKKNPTDKIKWILFTEKGELDPIWYPENETPPVIPPVVPPVIPPVNDTPLVNDTPVIPPEWEPSGGTAPKPKPKVQEGILVFYVDDKWIQIEPLECNNNPIKNSDVIYFNKKFDVNNKIYTQVEKIKPDKIILENLTEKKKIKWGFELDKYYPCQKWNITSSDKLVKDGLAVKYIHTAVTINIDNFDTFDKYKWIKQDFSQLITKNPNSSANLSKVNDYNFILAINNATDLDPEISEVYTADPGGIYSDTTYSPVSKQIKSDGDAIFCGKFDTYDGNVLYDYCSYLHEGVNNGSLYNSSGGYNGLGAFEFDGADDYIGITSSSELLPASEQSYHFQIKPAESKEMCVFGFAEQAPVPPTGAFDRTGCMVSTGEFEFYLTNTAGSSPYLIRTNKKISTNVFTDVLITNNGTNCTIYLNGTKDVSGACGVGYSGYTTPTLTIGQGRVRLQTPTYWNGTIDEFFLFNRSLNDAEALSIYSGKNNRTTYIPAFNENPDWTSNTKNIGYNVNISHANVTINSSCSNSTETVRDTSYSSLVTYLTFDNSTPLIDLMGNNNATNEGGAFSDTRGINGSFRFNTSQYLNLSNGASLNSDSFSAGFWFITYDTTIDQAILSKTRTDSWIDGWRVMFNDAPNTISFEPTSEGSNILSTSALMSGTWYYIFITLNNETLQSELYLDGLFVSNGTIGSAENNNANEIYIGKQGTSTQLGGSFDEFQFHNTTLSGSEIAKIYRQQRPHKLILELASSTDDITYSSYYPADQIDLLTGKIEGLDTEIPSGDYFKYRLVFNISADPETSCGVYDITFNFTDNIPPEQGTPTINSSSATNYTSENLTVYNVSTYDNDSDYVKNIIDWRLSGSSFTLLNMPFEKVSDSVFNATKDYSIYGNNGSEINGTIWNATGGYDGKGAYQFDGTAMDIDIVDNPNLELTDDFTISFWAKLNSITDWSGFISKSYYSSGYSNTAYTIKLDNTQKLDVWVADSSCDEIGNMDKLSTSTLATGSWHYYTITFDVGNSLKIYIDGNLDVEYTTGLVSTLCTTSTSPTRIGRDNNGGLSINGAMDEVMIFNRTLSSEQILAIYQNRTDLIVSQETYGGENWSACVTPNDGTEDGTEVCSTGLILNNLEVVNVNVTSDTGTNYTSENLTVNYTLQNGSTRGIIDWKLNDSSIAVLNMPFEKVSDSVINATKDYSDYGNNGSEIAGVIWNATGGYDGKGAYYFDGINDKITIPSSSSVNTFNSITLMAWVNPTNAVVDSPAIVKEGAGSVEEYGLGINANKFGCLLGDNWPLNSRDTGGTTDISNNQWQHIACTWNGTTVIDYLNGIAVQTTAWSGSIPAGSSILTIGTNSNAGSTWFAGAIDEVMVFNSSLTPEQILNIYNNRTDLISFNETSLDDSWSACVTPNDGYEDGAEVCSSNLTIISNSPPTQGTPIINSTLGTNYTTENITVYNVSTNDVNGDSVKNIFNWRLNNSSIAVLNMPFEGGVATDYSGYSHNGTVSDAVYNSTGGYDGKGAYQFDGVSTTINITDTNDLSFGDSSNDWGFSTSMWVKMSDATSFPFFIKGGLAGPDMEYKMFTNSSDSLTLVLGDGSGPSTITRSYTTPLTSYENIWIHISTTYDGSSTAGGIKLYVNGIQVDDESTTAGSYTAMENSAGDLIIGLDDFFVYPNGAIDEVQFFNRTLTPEQIINIYNNRTDLLSFNETSIGDNWSACVTPNDGTLDGTENCTDSLIIVVANNAPIINITAPAVNTDVSGNYTINWSVTELDGDALNISIYLDSETEIGINNSLVVDNLSSANTNYTYNFSKFEKKAWNLTIFSCETATSDLYCSNDTHEINIVSLTEEFNFTLGSNNLTSNIFNEDGTPITNYEIYYLYNGTYTTTQPDYDNNSLTYYWNFSSLVNTTNITLNITSTGNLSSINGDSLRYINPKETTNVSFDGITNYTRNLYQFYDYAAIFGKNSGANISLQQQLYNDNWYLNLFNVTDFDPTIKDEYSSSIGGIFDYTEWNALKERLQTQRDALAIYKFDISNPLDYSGYSKVGTNYQAIHNVTGGYDGGGAFEFDGVNDYITLDTDIDNNLAGTESFSATVWIKPQSIIDNGGILSLGYSGTRQIWIFTASAGSSLVTSHHIGGVKKDLIVGGLQTDKWTHIAVTWNNSNYTLYLDGEKNYTDDTYNGTLSAGTNGNMIGRLPGFAYFNGTIDEVVVYNRSLPTSEVLSLYNGTYNQSNHIPAYYETGNYTREQVDFNEIIVTSDINITVNGTFNNVSEYETYVVEGDSVLYYKLDNDSNDTTGQYNGTPTNVTYYDTGINKSAYFNAVSSVIDTGYGADVLNGTDAIGRDTITLSAWVKFNYPTLLYAKNIVAKRGQNLGITREGYGVGCHIWNGSGSNSMPAFIPNGEIDGDWHHYTCVYNGTDVILYYDGERYSSKDYGSGTNTIANNINNFTIGGTLSPSFIHDGFIDNVKIYNSTRSAEQILTDFHQSRPNKLSIKSRTSQDNVTWSGWYLTDWIELSTGKTTLNSSMPQGRYMDYELGMDNSKDKEFSPFVNNLIIEYSTINNTPPTHSTPTLTTPELFNRSTDNLTCAAVGSNDVDGDSIKPIYDWKVNGSSLAVLNMPFEEINSTIINNTQDYSSYENNGMQQGPVEWQVSGGYNGNGGYLFGNSSIATQIEIPEDQSLNFSTTCKFTQSVWINSKSEESEGAIFHGILGYDNLSIGSLGNRLPSLWIYNISKIHFGFGNGTHWLSVTTEAGNITNNSWYHIATTYNSTNYKLYVNGIEQWDVNYETAFLFWGSEGMCPSPKYSQLNIGCVDNCFNGTIDEVLIYNYSLSPEQVSLIYNNKTDMIASEETSSGDNWTCQITPNDGRDDGLIRTSNGVVVNYPPTHDTPTISSTYGNNYTNENITSYNVSTADVDNDVIKNIWNWKINGTSITLVNMPFEGGLLAEGNSKTKDYSEYGNNGTVVGATYNSTGGHDGGGAYEFDGDRDTINISTPQLQQNQSELSIFLWFKAGAFGDTEYSNSNGYLISNSRDVNPTYYGGFNLLVLNESDNYSVGSASIKYANTSGGTDSYGFANNKLIANEWYHIGFVFNGTHAISYINGEVNASGVLITSDNMIGGSIYPYTVVGSMGYDYPPFDFNGTIDEVLIFNRTLSQEQITAIYENRTDLITESETTRDDNWTSCITPNDGYEDGVEKCSEDLTILNSCGCPVIPINWFVDLTDTCGLQTSCNITGYNITFSGTGTFLTNETLYLDSRINFLSGVIWNRGSASRIWWGSK